jgi:hypothetical protein
MFVDGIKEHPKGNKTLIVDMQNAPVDYQQCLVKSKDMHKEMESAIMSIEAKVVKAGTVGEGVLNPISKTWIDLKNVLVYFTSEFVSADAICHLPGDV